MTQTFIKSSCLRLFFDFDISAYLDAHIDNVDGVGWHLGARIKYKEYPLAGKGIPRFPLEAAEAKLREEALEMKPTAKPSQ